MIKRRLLCIFLALLLAVTLLPVTGTVLAKSSATQQPDSVMSVTGRMGYNYAQTQYFDTVDEAMEAAEKRYKPITLTLLQNTTATSLTFFETTHGKKYTLNLNGYTLTLTPESGSAGIVLKDNANLTVTGEAGGTLAVTGGAGIHVNDGCSLTVEGGTVRGAGAAIVTAGTTTVTGGELQATGDTACIFNVTNGTLNVQDSDTGSPTINTSAATAFRSSGGILKITGGIYSNGVSVDSNPAMTLAKLLGSGYCAYTEDGVKVDLNSATSINAQLHIMQECINHNFDSNDSCTHCGLPKSNCPHLNLDANNFCNVCQKTFVAKWEPTSGETVYHTSLQDAFAAANGNTGTVTLLTTIKVDAPLKLDNGSVVTLNLDRHKLTCYTSAGINTIELEGSASLTVTGTTGTLTSGTNMHSVITAGESTTLTVESGTISCNRFYPAISSSGTVQITGGTLTSSNSAVVSMLGGSLTISGNPIITGEPDDTTFSNSSGTVISISGGTFPAGLSISSDGNTALRDTIATDVVLVDENGVPIALADTDTATTGYARVEAPKQQQAAPRITGIPDTAEYGGSFNITLHDTGAGSGKISWQVSDGVTVEPCDSANQFKVTVKTVGNITVQAIKAADDIYQGIRSTAYSVAAGKREVTPIIAGTLTKTWDGTVYTNNDLSIGLDNIALGDAPVVRAQSFSYSSPDAADPNTITATGIALKDGWDKFYTLKSDTATAEGSIQKATPTIAFAAAYNPGKAYDGQPAVKPTKEQLTLTVANFTNVQLAWSAVNGSSLTNGEPVDAGTYKLTASIPATANTEAASESISFEITKVAYPGAQPTLTVDIKNGGERTGTLLFADLFGPAPVPAGVEILSVSNPATQQIMASVTNPTGNKVEYKSKVNPAGTTATDVFDVQVKTRNYTDIFCKVTFQAVDKTPVVITGAAGATGLVYNGTAQAGYTGSPTSAYTGSYEISYTGATAGGGSYSSTGAPTDAGDYTVTIKVPDSDADYTGSVSYNFSIAKAVLAWDVSGLAATKFIGDGEAAVTGALAIAGLPAGQESYVTASPGEMATTGLAQQNTAGSYPVSISAAGGFDLTWAGAANQNNYDATALATAPVINATVSPRSYVYIAGARQTVNKDADALFVVDAPYDRYMDVKVNGVSLAAAHYTTAVSSTKVTLKAAYLATLAPGVYTLEVVFNDGSAITTFTVPTAAGGNPGTPGDPTTPDKPTTAPTEPTAPTAPTAPTEPTEPATAPAPAAPADTGDNTGIALWYSLAAIGLLGAAAILLIGKKRLFTKK